MWRIHSRCPQGEIWMQSSPSRSRKCLPSLSSPPSNLSHCQGVSLAFKDITLNEKPSKLDGLNKAQEMDQGMVKMTVLSPSVLLAAEPAPITDRVVEWLMVVLGDKSCAELFKLSVVSVACNHFYFTWEQALEVGWYQRGAELHEWLGG